MAAPTEVSPGKSLANFLNRHEIPFVGDPASLSGKWQAQTYVDAVLLREKSAPGQNGSTRRVELTETEDGRVIAHVGLQASSAVELVSIGQNGPFPQPNRGSVPAIENLKEVEIGGGLILRGEGRLDEFGRLKEEIRVGDEDGEIFVSLDFKQSTQRR